MKKDLFALLVVVFISIFVFSGTKIQTVDEYYLTHIDDITEESKTVYLTIRCDTILDNRDDLDPSLKYELKDGDEIIWCYTCDLGRDVGCYWEVQQK